jgi:hypothetical protein
VRSVQWGILVLTAYHAEIGKPNEVGMRARAMMAKTLRHPRMTALTLAAILSATVMIGSASSMPAEGLNSPAVKQALDDPRHNGLQRVGWVCGPYRCWWRPFAGGPFWAPYRYDGPGYYACNPYYNPSCYYGYRW